MTKDPGISKQSETFPSIDWSMLDSLAALGRPGTPDLRIRILEAFLSSAPPLMKDLSVAVIGSDSGAIAKAAHSLKSSSMNMGATLLGERCAQLERLGREECLDQAAGLLAEAEDEFRLVREVFAGLLEKLGKEGP
jgi:two-component system sensor histidine kinase/response regulator